MILFYSDEFCRNTENQLIYRLTTFLKSAVLINSLHTTGTSFKVFFCCLNECDFDSEIFFVISVRGQ